MLSVNGLIEKLVELQNEGMGELPVRFAYDYGDHCHTKVAGDVDNVEAGDVKYSDYHSMMEVVESDSDEEDDEDEGGNDSNCILLS